MASFLPDVSKSHCEKASTAAQITPQQGETDDAGQDVMFPMASSSWYHSAVLLQ